MLENPFLALPQVESPKSRSWGSGFAFGFQGPAQSTMTPAEFKPEDDSAFNLGVLAGQDAAINGLSFENACVDLNSEGPSVPHLTPDGLELLVFLRGIMHKLSGSIAEGVLLVVTLSIELETFSDDPDTALEQQAAALQNLLQGMGIDGPMELFLGGGVDLSTLGCELLLTPIFRTQEAATVSAKALGRSRWFVASWRTDQSGGVNIAATSPQQ
jgi:hypothetical protein